MSNFPPTLSANDFAMSKVHSDSLDCVLRSMWHVTEVCHRSKDINRVIMDWLLSVTKAPYKVYWSTFDFSIVSFDFKLTRNPVNLLARFLRRDLKDISQCSIMIYDIYAIYMTYIYIWLNINVHINSFNIFRWVLFTFYIFLTLHTSILHCILHKSLKAWNIFSVKE